jgi:hypothetical protein
MAHRSINSKRARRIRKALGRQPLDPHIDLVEWLVSRRHASTRGAARRMLEEGRVMSESHIIGRQKVRLMQAEGADVERWIATPVVPAAVKPTLCVVDVAHD